MCGLLGFCGTPHLSDDARLKRARVLEALFVANVSRGDDASGIAVYADGAPIIHKKAVDAYEFITLPATKAALRTREASMLMGHTRMGTHGKNIDRNAHPFKERSVIGAHNGVIDNFGALEQGSTWKKPADVDSQNVFRLLSLASAYDPEVGFAGAYTNLLKDVKGSLALTWTDARDPGFLYMMAHNNPLSLIVVPNVGAFWSSQMDHLAPVIQAAYGEAWGVMTLKEDTLYRMVWSGETMSYQEWPIQFPKGTSWGGSTYRDVMQQYTPNITTDNGWHSEWGCENCGAEKAAYLPEDDMNLCNPCIRDWNQVKGGLKPDEFLFGSDDDTPLKAERKASL